MRCSSPTSPGPLRVLDWESRSQGYLDNCIPMLNVLLCHPASQRTQTFELHMLITPARSHFVQFTNRPAVTVLPSGNAGLGPGVGESLPTALPGCSH